MWLDTTPVEELISELRACEAVISESRARQIVVLQRLERAHGPRVGPETLREALCNGAVRLIGIEHGRPVVTSDAAHTIPGAIRAFVARRDSRCTIEGCRSRYRLQPHHISHRAHGGDHDPANLTTLCWYHHHVAGTHTLRWLPSCWPDLEGTNARARVSTATATASTPTAHH